MSQPLPKSNFTWMQNIDKLDFSTVPADTNRVEVDLVKVLVLALIAYKRKNRANHSFVSILHLIQPAKTA